MISLLWVFTRSASTFALGLMFWNAYLTQMGYLESTDLVRQVLVPAALTGGVLTVVHFLVARTRGVVADFAVEQRAQVELPSAGNLATVVVEISQAKPWKLVSRSETEATFRSGFRSGFSFGEVIQLSLKGQKAIISSKPLFPLTTADFGQNFVNVRSLAGLLSSSPR